MRTEADICNVALARVGQRQLISSLSEASAPAQLCKALFAPARDALLGSAPWPWATRHQVLAELDESRSGWAHVYALPTDCLFARYLFAGARPGSMSSTPWSCSDELAARRTPEVPFAIEVSADGTKRVLVTDQPAAELIYTVALETPAVFPPLFADALAWRLAQDLALSLAVKPQLALAVDTKAERALGEAIAASFRESAEDPQPDSEFITVRG